MTETKPHSWWRRVLPCVIAPLLVVASDISIGQDRPSFTRDQAFARINRLSRPIEDHRYLQPLVGEWHGEGVARILPSHSFEKIRCRLRVSWVLGARFLRQSVKCVGDDYKFEGIGFLGFDRLAGRYTGTSIDGSDTGYTAIEGRRKDAVTFVLTLRHNDALSRRRTMSTLTIAIANPRRHTQTVTVKDPPSGKPVVLLKITYSR